MASTPANTSGGRQPNPRPAFVGKPQVLGTTMGLAPPNLGKTPFGDSAPLSGSGQVAHGPAPRPQTTTGQLGAYNAQQQGARK
jgi:hypothetical protein